jgi:hypothetical protein
LLLRRSDHSSHPIGSSYPIIHRTRSFTYPIVHVPDRSPCRTFSTGAALGGQRSFRLEKRFTAAHVYFPSSSDSVKSAHSCSAILPYNSTQPTAGAFVPVERYLSQHQQRPMAKMALRATCRSLSWLYFDSVFRIGSLGFEALTSPRANGTAFRITGSP